jgi:hypothetical protein
LLGSRAEQDRNPRSKFVCHFSSNKTLEAKSQYHERVGTPLLDILGRIT